MPNTHAIPDVLSELSAQHFDLLPACIVSTTWPTAPGSGLTIAAFATQGYVRKGSLLSYVDQPARAITLPSAAGTYYLALTTDTHSTPGSFTRVAGSHYAYLQSASAPTYPDGSTPIASAVVSGGHITSVDTTPALTPPLSRQTADAVAITDGRIALGGHAPTGVLDVQGSVVASDLANMYFGMRVWPQAPSGATVVQAIRVEGAAGPASGSASFTGLTVNDQPASSAVVSAIVAAISAGANRYNFYTAGTAQNYFAGNVGIANSSPSYPLDVTGEARLSGRIGINTVPTAGRRFNILNPSGEYGLWIQQAVSGAGNPIIFVNSSAVGVGSITTTDSATSYNTSSDIRLKHAVQNIANALYKIAALRPVTFTWNADDSPGEGFLAHELQQIIPHAVTGEPDELNADGSVKPQQVDHSKLVPWLVAGMQELLNRVATLEAQIAVLQTQGVSYADDATRT